MNYELILTAALAFAAFVLGWMARKPKIVEAPSEPKITPPEINHEATHKMDDDALPKPARTHSAQQLRDWAGSGISAKPGSGGNPKPPNEAGEPPK